MDKMLYIGNWKSHKNTQEAKVFFKEFSEGFNKIAKSDIEVIIAPSYTLLPICKELTGKYKLPIKLAAQNLSSFPEGSYTGEVNAQQIKEFASHVIIGHSERLKYLHEKESDIENKIREAKEVGLTPILCVQDENSKVFEGVKTIAYEPPSAIGTGNADTPEHIAEVFSKLMDENPHIDVLYGGSVDKDNVKDLLKVPNISGFLVGGASLSADSFLSLLNG